ncbi:MAG: hypothetical protein KF849_05300, partial [Rhizobiaceae bacterium]|nr:hypothetical protein [Rhizobiaceae bacterium]
MTLDSFGFGAVYVDDDGVGHVQAVAVADDYPQTAGGVTTEVRQRRCRSGRRAGDQTRRLSYSFTTYAPLSHTATASADGVEETLDIAFGFTVTDGDGDTATGSLTVRVNDDAPVSTGSVVATPVLDDEAQIEFTPVNAGGGFDVSPNERTLSGGPGALFSVGADGFGSLDVTPPELFVVFKDADGFAQVESVSWSGSTVDGVTTWTATSPHYPDPLDGPAGLPAAVLVIGADGSYTFTLNAPVAHSLALPLVEETDSLVFAYTVSDGDGDAVSGSLTVRVNDDTPTSPLAVTPSRILDDEAQSEFTPVNAGGISDPSTNYKTVSGGAGTLFSMGADGLRGVEIAPPSFRVVYKDALGFAQTESVTWSAGVTSAGGVTTWTATSDHYPDPLDPASGPAAVLVIRADGSYSFEINAPLAHALPLPYPVSVEENLPLLAFGYAATDGDGDQTGGILTIRVNDDTPTAANVTAGVRLDDEGQVEFTPTNAGGASGDASGAETSVSSTIVGTLFKIGADGLASVALTPPSFQVVFKDDLGFAQTESVSWTAVGATSAGGVTTWTATSDHYPSGSPAAVLVINADGTYSFTLYAPVVHGTAGTAEEDRNLDFFYTATDGDGDSASARLRIQVNDDTPVSAALTTRALDDEAQTLFDGNADGAGDVSPDAFSVSDDTVGALFSMGADGLKTIVLTLPSFSVVYEADGFALSELVTWSPGVATAGGVTTWTATNSHYPSGSPAAVLVINADGTYSFTLYAPLAHLTTADASGVEENATLNIGFTVTDGDNDTAAGTLRIEVNDDAPLAHVVTALSPVLDDDVFGGNANGSGDVGDETVVTGDAGTLFTAGSDGVRSVTLDSFGFGAVYVDDDGVGHVQAVAVADDYPQTAGGVTTWKFVSADVDPVAELVIRADGSYSFTTYAPLSHLATASADGVEETLDIAFGFTVTDGDGDTATG